MAAGFYFQSYDEWRAAYGARCGISLTPDYIGERLAALQDSTDRTTKEFTAFYGEAYRQQVVAWFERALREPTR